MINDSRALTLGMLMFSNMVTTGLDQWKVNFPFWVTEVRDE